MAELNYGCDVSQGFNFNLDAQTYVGHINKLKVADKDMAEDFSVTDPENVTGDAVKVVGVVSNMYWPGGIADSIEFGCQVSSANKTTLSELVYSDMSDTTIECAWTIYSYDPDEKKYYKCFHTDGAALKGLINKSGDQLSIAVDTDQSDEVVSPRNFAFNLGIMPEDSAQDTHIAFSVNSKMVKQWGITVE